MFKFNFTNLLVFLLCISISTHGQINLDQFQNLQLATRFSNLDERNRIINLFHEENKEYTLYKGDFLGMYRITSSNIPFDFYGDADYKFQYVKDTLVSLEITFAFQEGKIDDFSRLLKQIMPDFDNKFIRLNYKG